MTYYTNCRTSAALVTAAALRFERYVTPKTNHAQQVPHTAAQIAMSNRTRVSFGKAYIRDVISGAQSDFDKQVSHGVALGLGTRSALRRMGLPNLRMLLAETLTSSDVEPVRNAPCKH